MVKVEFDEVPGGKELVDQQLQALGPATAREKKLLYILLVDDSCLGDRAAA